jgi:predicted membrane protein
MKKKNVYVEIISFTNGLVVLYLLTKNKWLLYISVSIAFASILIPAFARVIGGVLQKIIFVLGVMINAVILGIVFIFVLSPISVIYRLMNKEKSFNNLNKITFFIDRDYTFKSDDFKNQW